LILNLTALLVALFGIVMLREKPTALQWCGILMNLAGVFVYFYPMRLGGGTVIGFSAALVSLLANVFGAILGRKMNMNGAIRPIPLTVISMGIGAVVLLASGVVMQGFPPLELRVWLLLLLD